MPHTIVIVGSGFSGTVLAASLLRRRAERDTEVILIERGPEMGPGLAYEDGHYPYLLNVPAVRLSADSSDPLQFLRFARREMPDAAAEDFLPRPLYGRYLKDVLDRAGREAAARVRLRRLPGEVTGVDAAHAGAKLMVEWSGGPAIAADEVILAPGNPPPARLACAAALERHPAYWHNPWKWRPQLAAKGKILIIGTGLTMVDMALRLCDMPGGGPQITAISRRGLLARPQTAFQPRAIQHDPEALLAAAPSLRRVLAAVRRLAYEAQDAGADWREVVSYVRHLAPRLWQRLPEAERRRFLRHLQCYWDVHRHRMPPQLDARVTQLRNTGQLRIVAGRILSMEPQADGVRIEWRPRGEAEAESMAVEAVINATGPDYSLSRSPEPLLQRLRAQGLIMGDSLHLGLRTDPRGACIGADGTAHPHLHYLGPMLRADHWEATAVSELREHAERLAARLAGGAG